MLTSLLMIPILGSCFILLLPEISLSNKQTIKQIGLVTSLINLLLSIIILVAFDSNSNEYQFVTEFGNLSFCHFYIGVDGISLWYVLLTTIITPIALLANYSNLSSASGKKSIKFFVVAFLVLETLQIALFVVLDLVLFYIFFESVLPILFVIILIYGSGQMKERSAMFFFLYTLAGSLFMLLAILQIQNRLGTTDFTILQLNVINLDDQKIVWLAFFIALAVKTPLFPIHIWLPKAHSDAPLAASILLAGTILKFATYGYIRILLNSFPEASVYYGPFIQTIAIITLIYASLTTIVQYDTKELIAYSSICHMAIVILGIFSNSIQGIEGAILLSLGHGLVSPALFICVGGICYDQFHTRNLLYLRGLVQYMPVFISLFFILILANSGIPLTIDWLGEQLSLIGIWNFNPIVAALAGSSILFSACYSLYLYNRISYGVLSPYIQNIRDLNRREFHLLGSLIILTFVLGFLPNCILEPIHLSVSNLLFLAPPLN